MRRIHHVRVPYGRVGELWPFLLDSLVIAFLFSLDGSELSASDFAPTPRSGSSLA
jgi:hypothetical protein